MSLTSDQCQILNAIKNGKSSCHSIIEETKLDEHIVRANIEELKNQGLIKAGSYADGIEPGTFYTGCQLTNQGHLELQNC